MTQRMRKALPFVAPLLAGVVGYLLIGEGPSSSAVRTGDTAGWELPTIAATDMAAAAPVWAARAPWGNEVEMAQGPSEIATRPVGVVAVGDSLFALFTQGDAVVRVALGDSLADGGQVTGIRPDVVEWIDGAGATQRRELMVDVVEVVAAPAQPTGARARGAARAADRANSRNLDRSNRSRRPTPPPREPGQRRARTNVPESGSDTFKSRRPSSTGD
jgi:hypothetical protein